MLKMNQILKVYLVIEFSEVCRIKNLPSSFYSDLHSFHCQSIFDYSDALNCERILPKAVGDTEGEIKIKSKETMCLWTRVLCTCSD